MADYPADYHSDLGDITSDPKDDKPLGVPIFGSPTQYLMRAKQISTGNIVRWDAWGAPDSTGLYSGVSTSDLTSGSIVIAGEA